MKIAIFSDCYLDLTGGIVTNINAEKAELERRGHTVYVFSSAYSRHRAAREKLARQHIYPVPNCKILGRGLTPIARRPPVVIRYLKQNFPELKDFDIFYIHYEAGCSIAGLELAREYKIPAVQFMHGREDTGEWLLMPKGLRTFVAKLMNKSHAKYLPHAIEIPVDNYLATNSARANMWSLVINHAQAASLVLTPSEHFRQKLLHYGLSRPSRALHHGLSGELVKSKVKVRQLAPGEELKMIWHSRVSGEKRPLVMLEALRLFSVQYPDARYHLAVYGGGGELKKARRYAKQHHLNVTFHGDTPFQDLWQDIQNSHLDILVSYNYDTFGTTIIEAAAAGTPVLIADPDLAEVSPEGGYILASSPSAAGIARALGKIIDQPKLIEQMSAAMLTGRAALSIENKIDQLEKLFQSMLK